MIYFVAAFSVIIYGLLIYWLVRSTSDVRPIRLIVCVLLGFVAAGMALLLEYLWNQLMGDLINAHRSLIILESFIGVGLIEETAKWMCLVFIINYWGGLNRYTAGILFACGIAVGFNLVEGSLYVFTGEGLLNIVVRGFTAVPVHFLFAVIMGFFFARYKLESSRFLWPSILVPLILHGLYDFFILQQYDQLLLGGALLVFVGCLSLSIWVSLAALSADRLRVSDK